MYSCYTCFVGSEGDEEFVPQCYDATEANELLNSLGAINYVGKRDLSDRRERNFPPEKVGKSSRRRLFSRKYSRERQNKTAGTNFAEEKWDVAEDSFRLIKCVFYILFLAMFMYTTLRRTDLTATDFIVFCMGISHALEFVYCAKRSW